MATYKVIQDIEAEDKLLGPLTFRQFVYAGACVLFLYFTFLAITKNAGFMAVIFLPVAVFTGFFAWPWSGDQPTEVWALAKIRFLIKPRKRIWNQSGVKELVTVTAPKRVDVVYTNGLTQSEVQNRLRALADTIDSRGWATKNVNVNLYSGAQGITYTESSSDRLVEASSLPKQVPEIDIQASDDIMEESNPVARQFDTMIAASTKAHREEILSQLRETSAAANPTPDQQANNYWFLQQQPSSSASVPTNAVTFNTQVVTPGAVPSQMPVAPVVNDATPTPDEQALIEQLHEQDQRESINPYNRWHTIKPLSEQAASSAPVQQQQVPTQAPAATPAEVPVAAANSNGFPFLARQQQAQQIPQAPQYGAPATPLPYSATPQSQQMPQTAPAQVTPPPDPAILQLASNDDLDVATIAREANKRKELQDEVVISLH